LRTFEIAAPLPVHALFFRGKMVADGQMLLASANHINCHCWWKQL